MFRTVIEKFLSVLIFTFTASETSHESVMAESWNNQTEFLDVRVFSIMVSKILDDNEVHKGESRKTEESRKKMLRAAVGTPHRTDLSGGNAQDVLLWTSVLIGGILVG